MTPPSVAVLVAVVSTTCAVVLAGAVVLLWRRQRALADSLRTARRQRRALRRKQENQQAKALAERSAREPGTSAADVAGSASDPAQAPAPPDEPAPFPGDDMTTAGRAALGALVFDGDQPAVVLCLHSLSPQQFFAGIKTALRAAAALAAELSLPLRVITFEPAEEPHAEIEQLVANALDEAGHPELVAGLRVSTHDARDASGHTSDDVFLATFWTTAWCIGELVRDGHVRAERVVYLVQDFEPGFYPWGQMHLQARATYDSGFRLLVNSTPLAAYLRDHTGREVAPQSVFGPRLDTDRLAAAAKAWKPAEPGLVRVLFYSRPSTPRNMFVLGVQALRAWADSLPEGVRAVVRLAGAPTPPVDLGPRAEAQVLDKLTHAAYFELLSDTDIGLALMSSPHPGHLALEMPLAGITTVTNQFEGYRTDWVEGLLLAEARPPALAEALERARVHSLGRDRHDVPADGLRGLGGSLEEAVVHVTRQLAR